MSPRGAHDKPEPREAEIDDMVSRADERLREDPQDADALFVVAAGNVSMGRFSEAVDVLSRLIRIRVDYPGVWLLKRTVHEALGEWIAAEACNRAASLYEDT